MTWLCGDVGGTHTRLGAWAGVLGERRVWRSAQAGSLAEIVEAWLLDSPRPDGACIALPGPVKAGRCRTTNLPWNVDAAELEGRFGFPFHLVNDFHAAALGAVSLGPEHRVQIGGTTAEPGGVCGVLGAGTGLGEAVVSAAGEVLPGEGGHADFGPSNVRELELCAWLHRRYGRASWEHLLSGPGLVNLAEFWFEKRAEPRPAWLDTSDAPACITSQEPELCSWFCELYGAAAGNLALRVLPAGGIFLTGGIAPRLVKALGASSFRSRFEQKGPVSHAIRDIPCFVVTHRDPGLLGTVRVLQGIYG